MMVYGLSLYKIQEDGKIKIGSGLSGADEWRLSGGGTDICQGEKGY